MTVRDKGINDWTRPLPAKAGVQTPRAGKMAFVFAHRCVVASFNCNLPRCYRMKMHASPAHTIDPRKRTIVLPRHKHKLCTPQLLLAERRGLIDRDVAEAKLFTHGHRFRAAEL